MKPKIIATIGPASKDKIEEMEKAGMDIARINTAYTNEIDLPLKELLIDVRHWKVLENFELKRHMKVALSYVNKKDDIFMAREYTDNEICAKIETKESVKNLDEIVKHSDLVMVARGDLGKEFGIHNIPIVQEKIISVAKKYEKPFIVATEVFKSMLHHPEPSRGETIDVYNAVKSGAWAIMLADETAIGNHPVEAVKWLKKLIDHFSSENGNI